MSLNFIGSSDEQLIPTKFYSYSTSQSKVTVRFISEHYVTQYAIPLQVLEFHSLTWLSPFSKPFITKISLQILGPSKVTSCLILNYFLTNSHCNIFSTTSATELVRTIFQSLFESNTIILKSHICNSSCIEIILCLLFSTIKDWPISKSNQTIVYSDEWMLVNEKVFEV